jgi:chemotaxis signal transduction protein
VEDSDFRPGRYLTFRVARHEFAMDAARVRAIIPWHELVAEQSEGLAGSATFQGRDFPVIDLPGKLGFRRASPGREPWIVVVEVATGGDIQLAGFVADRICDVVTAREKDFIHGKLRMGGRPRRVLDPDVILRAGCQKTARAITWQNR